MPKLSELFQDSHSIDSASLMAILQLHAATTHSLINGPVNISTIFPFFQNAYSSVFVNINGMIRFQTGITEFTPQKFPLIGAAGVAPFWADIDTRCKGSVFYRDEVRESILTNISAEIRQAFPQFPNYKASWSFIVTWDMVPPYSCGSPTNTFQAVLVTNGRYSFTIFNYESLTWSYGSASGGIHAQAGFNAGDGNTSYAIEGSFSSSVTQINNKSNVGIPGKWIFRIDQANITEGGCNTQGYFIVNPTVVYFTGGEDIFVTGPCFKESDNVSLLFDYSKAVACEVYDSSNAICKVPYLDRIGKIPLNLTVNNNSNFEGFLISKDVPMNSNLFSVKPNYDDSELTLEEIAWNFTTGARRARSENRELVQFKLFYLLIDTQDSLYPQVIELNSNFTEDNKLANMNMLKEFNVLDKPGYMVVAGVFKDKVLRRSAHQKFKFVTQWLDSVATTIVKIKDEVAAKCNKWHANQSDPRPLLDALPPCPRVIQPLPNGKYPQTSGDFKLDSACNPNDYFGVLSCDIFHSGAKGYYRSISSALGAGQQCCYDKNNRLLVGPPGGGTLDVAHSDVSKRDHFETDVLPYFYCCNPFTKACDKYYEKRPSDDGSGWSPPVPASWKFRFC
jgi:hypothetical protein